jgi:hypothetical protein
MKYHKTLQIEAEEDWNESKKYKSFSDVENAEYIWRDGHYYGASKNQTKAPAKKDIIKIACEKYKSTTQINAFILGAEWAKKMYKESIQ